MKTQEEIKNRINLLTSQDSDYKSAMEIAYLKIGLAKPEDYLKHLQSLYEIRLRHDKWELDEDQIILNTINWVLDK